MGKLAWSVMILCASVGFGAPVSMDIDPAASTMDFRLCIEGNCDTDTSRVDGSIEIALDDYQAPREITLHDFDMVLLDGVDLEIGIFLGDLVVAGRNVAARYARPGTPHTPAPLSGIAFTFRNVPTAMEGRLSYVATGTMCVLFLGAGLPCEDVIDLRQLGTQNTGEITGEVSVAGEALTLLFEPRMVVPLDPSNPELGDLTLTGRIIAHGTAPSCPERPGAIADLRLAKTGDGILLAWASEPNSSDGYRAYSVNAKHLLPPRGTNPDASLACETRSQADTDCAAAPSGAAMLLYQVVGLCADGSEGLN